MAELKYKLTNDVLFKALFVKYRDLLKRLVAALLGIRVEDIGPDFRVTNSAMPPEAMGEKFCHLDINMTVNGQRVDLEVQVEDKGDYTERSLYYWAREYSSALPVGEDYSQLPRTIVISILAYPQFRCAEYHSEFGLLEVRRHERLTDRLAMHYFELPKLPEVVDAGDELKLWLAFFKADTDEKLEELVTVGGEIMVQAVEAYRSVSASDEFRELERLRDRARHNEASALAHERRQIAKNLRNRGLPVDDIAAGTGLTVDEVLKL
ncbi:MAG: Rpn family recombination-promoting nuclease/putative transposase [Chitinispirillia bacterium]|nr:Rpn family recombination-promoting nuclease/putative transposase [Chitinispirillia bacterium]MCL2219092.1 Rpn family recombination-promoting nuclease/putative transposase [Chitinispirillia bacterium]